jgi:hypothetical protein
MLPRLITLIHSNHNSDLLSYNITDYRQEMIDSLNKEVFNIRGCPDQPPPGGARAPRQRMNSFLSFGNELQTS